MPAYLVIGAILGAFCFSLFTTWVVKKYVVAAGMYDRPSSRSSHSKDTPRGGGLAIVITIITATAILASLANDRHSLLIIATVVLLLSITGWLDDRYSLTVRSRLSIHLLIGIFVVSTVGAFDQLELNGISISFGIVGSVVTIGWIIWVINLYNFMDGIDGLAASQGAVASCALGIWFTLHKNYVLALFCYVIMAASLGFLVWNWSPARIFMGDVGSLTLGGIFAVFAVLGQQSHDIPWGAFIILLGLFIADATVTLIRRALGGEIVWRAHRSHFYQRAVAIGYNHAQVTIFAILVSVVLATLATLEMLRISPRSLWLILSAAMLGGIAVFVSKQERKTALNTRQ